MSDPQKMKALEETHEVVSRFISDPLVTTIFGASKENLNSTLDDVMKAMKFLVANGIDPHAGHQRVAMLWARGQLTDQEFLLLAALISAKAVHDDRT